MAHRFTAVLLSFFALALSLIYWGYARNTLQFQGREEIGVPDNSLQRKASMSQLVYFKSSAQGGAELTLQTRRLTMAGEKEWARFDHPRGSFFNHQGQAFRFQSQRADYHQAQGELLMSGRAKITSPTSQVMAEEIHYFAHQGRFNAQGAVQGRFQHPDMGEVRGRCQSAQGWTGQGRFRCRGKVAGEIRRKFKFESGMHFSANEIYLDLSTQLLQLTGAVELQRPPFTASGQQGEVHLANYGKRLKYYVLSDDVRVTVAPRSPAQTVRRAYGERLEGYIQQRKIVLSGAPRVVQGDNVIHGHLITLFEHTQVIEVEDSASKLLIKKDQP